MRRPKMSCPMQCPKPHHAPRREAFTELIPSVRGVRACSDMIAVTKLPRAQGSLSESQILMLSFPENKPVSYPYRIVQSPARVVAKLEGVRCKRIILHRLTLILSKWVDGNHSQWSSGRRFRIRYM